MWWILLLSILCQFTHVILVCEICDPTIWSWDLFYFCSSLKHRSPELHYPGLNLIYHWIQFNFLSYSIKFNMSEHLVFDQISVWNWDWYYFATVAAWIQIFSLLSYFQAQIKVFIICTGAVTWNTCIKFKFPQTYSILLRGCWCQ